MKNQSYVINAILAIAVIILFVLHFSSKNTIEGANAPAYRGVDSTATLPIAYVNTDTLLNNYNYAKDASDALMSQRESMSAKLNRQAKKFQDAQSEIQNKVNTNQLVDIDQQRQAAMRLQRMQADLEQANNQMSNQLQAAQYKMSNDVADSVRVCIALYNKTAHYQIILSNSGMNNVLIAKEKYDITNDVLKLLNSRYVSPKK